MGQGSSQPLWQRTRTPYEVLNVPETASLVEIKKAYRKLALEYHPDSASSRSLNRDSGAFVEINTAYETLCQMHETKELSRGTYCRKKQEADMNIQECLVQAKRLEKIGEGDYALINNLFAQITEIEKSTRGAQYRAPTFGYAKGNPKLFYSFYSAFSSLRHFNITPYDVAPQYDRLTRQHKRDIEAEVRSIISSKRQEYSAGVRELARLLQKKDPRVVDASKKVIDLKLTKLTVTKDGKEIRDSKELTEEEKNLLSQEYTKQKKARKESEGDAPEPKEEKDLFVCAPCKKTFKSMNQLDNHLKSRKHKDAMESMSAEEMKKLLHDLEAQKISGAIPTTPTTPEAEAEEKEKEKEKVEQKQKQKQKQKNKQKEEDPASTDPALSQPSSTPSEKSSTDKKPAKKPLHTPKKEKAKKPDTQKQDIRSGASFALSCAKCKATFTTRNQLFAHLKETNHAAYKI
ncbi:DnaJ-like protein subfamily A member 5 [Nematocida sp. AWRm77]|nr:DnaJ-like protein subfamily A member 5 [Nematocida sp. AWRm77]